MTRARNDMDKAVAAFLRLISGDDPAMIMREAEVKKGFTIVPVGSVPWLSATHWGARDVVSTDGIEVRLVAIGAQLPGSGALKRLLIGIEAAGLRPVVICPMATMEAILKRWGWRCRQIDGDFDEREEQWRPPAGWQARTGATATAGPVGPATAPEALGGPDRRHSCQIGGDDG